MNKRLGGLIERLASGDVSALAEIAFLMEGTLRSIGNIYYDNRADVEACIENLYLLLYQKAGDFRANVNACVWIIRLFQDVIFARQTAGKREGKIAQAELNGGTMDEAYLENHRLLRKTFDKLTEEERDLFLYYYWAKCAVFELAEGMGESEAELEKNLRKLEDKIKKS